MSVKSESVRQLPNHTIFSCYIQFSQTTIMPASKFQQIIKKLKTDSCYPNYIRHKNGDTLDNRVENLEWVHIKDAFRNLQWKVDWVCYLNNEEIKFVYDMFAVRS